jgi:O-antigen ligase
MKLAPALLAAGLFAIAVPLNLAANWPPSATLLNQAAAWFGWGLVLLVKSAAGPVTTAGRGAVVDLRGSAAMAAALVIVVLACAAGALQPALRGAAAAQAATVAAAVAIVLAATAARTVGAGDALPRAVLAAVAIAAALGAITGAVQVFAPAVPDGSWIAAVTIPGRASGNLRQPNHLASVLLWGLVGAAWLFERAVRAVDARWRVLDAVLGAGLVFGLVLTASRTGALGVLLLAVWGFFDRNLSRATRLALFLAPLLYLSLWWLVDVFMAAEGGTAFAGTQRLHEADPSSSRFAIWSNTLELIRLHPWTGVGTGNFNFAWTLTEFSHPRPVAFFDHTHNLALQLWVELGLPLGTLVLGLLGYALWRAFRAAAQARDAETALTQRCAFMVVLLALLHSLVEYPLWYAHFLFPVAFCWGLCLVRPRAATAAEVADPIPPKARVRRVLGIVGAALLAGGTVMVWDYMRVVPIFDPPANAVPLRERIAEGQRSWFFAHHADYALVTTYKEPVRRLDDFRRPVHFLLDARLMQAWAEALAAAGEVDRARWIARRLAEFHRPQSQAFFAPCSEPTPVGAPRPFQCEAPLRRYSFEDFR